MAEIQTNRDEYVEICRKLNLPRDWEYGDWWAYSKGASPSGMCRWDEYDDDIGFPDDDNAVWLPTEGQILDLLEAEGWGQGAWCVTGDEIAIFGSPTSHTGERMPDGRYAYAAEVHGPDRRTALLKLYAAVKGIDL
jgi:hypothetical protein